MQVRRVDDRDGVEEGAQADDAAQRGGFRSHLVAHPELQDGGEGQAQHDVHGGRDEQQPVAPHDEDAVAFAGVMLQARGQHREHHVGDGRGDHGALQDDLVGDVVGGDGRRRDGRGDDEAVGLHQQRMGDVADRHPFAEAVELHADAAPLGRRAGLEGLAAQIGPQGVHLLAHVEVQHEQPDGAADQDGGHQRHQRLAEERHQHGRHEIGHAQVHAHDAGDAEVLEGFDDAAIERTEHLHRQREDEDDGGDLQFLRADVAVGDEAFHVEAHRYQEERHADGTVGDGQAPGHVDGRRDLGQVSLAAQGGHVLGGGTADAEVQGRGVAEQRPGQGDHPEALVVDAREQQRNEEEGRKRRGEEAGERPQDLGSVHACLSKAAGGSGGARGGRAGGLLEQLHQLRTHGGDAVGALGGLATCGTHPRTQLR